MFIPKKISESLVAANPYLKVMNKKFVDKEGRESNFLITSNNKKKSIWTFIMPITEDDKIIYLKEYRYGPEKIVINFPVWMLDDGLSELDNCKKELREETGYESQDIVFLWESIVENYFEWSVKYYIAKWCKKTSNPKYDFSEKIEVYSCSPEEFEKMILNWEILSSKTCYCFFLAKSMWFL